MWHREPDTLAPGLTWLPRLEALAEEGGSHGQLGGGGVQSGQSCPNAFSSRAPSLPGFQQVNQGHLCRDPFRGRREVSSHFWVLPRSLGTSQEYLLSGRTAKASL